MGLRHARNILAAGHELAVVHDEDAKAAAAVARLTGARRGTLAAVLRDGAAEGVVIASPASVHAIHISACVRAGRPFLCEKPLATDLTRARQTVKQMQAQKAWGMLGLNRRYDAQFKSLRAQIKRGAIGEVQIVKLVSRSAQTPPPAYLRDAGGLLRDKGAHYFDLACWLTRQLPAAVQAIGKRLFSPELEEAGDYDTAMVTLELASGALCHFDFSRRAPYGQDERIEVMGSKGMLQCSFPAADTCVRTRADGIAESAGLHSTWQEHYAPTYQAELEAFITCLRRGRPSPIPVTAGLLAEQVAAAAAKSIATGRRMEVDTTGVDPACVAT